MDFILNNLGLILAIIIIIVLVVGYFYVKNLFGKFSFDSIVGNDKCRDTYQDETAYYNLLDRTCYTCPEDKKPTMSSPNAEDGCKGSCPGGTFEHWLSGKCYNCPDGYNRTMQTDPEAKDACLNPRTCKQMNKNWFEHGLTRDCYECPDNMWRTLSGIDSADACEGKCQDMFDDDNAFEHGLSNKCYTCGKAHRTIYNIDGDKACKLGSCEDLGSNTFENILTGECYSCPDGYNRHTLAGEKTDKACLFGGTCADLNNSNSFQNGLTGKCYDCPEDFYHPLLADINSERACIPKFGVSCSDINEDHPNSGKMELDLLTGQCHYCPNGYNRTLFTLPDDNKACKSTETCNDLWAGSFEHWNTGRCYKCPEGYKRSLSNIDGDRACFKNIFNDDDVLKIIPKEVEFKAAITDETKNRYSKAITSESDKNIKNSFMPATKSEKDLFKPAESLGSIFRSATFLGENVSPAAKRASRIAPAEFVKKIISPATRLGPAEGTDSNSDKIETMQITNYILRNMNEAKNRHKIAYIS